MIFLSYMDDIYEVSLIIKYRRTTLSWEKLNISHENTSQCQSFSILVICKEWSIELEYLPIESSHCTRSIYESKYRTIFLQSTSLKKFSWRLPYFCQGRKNSDITRYITRYESKWKYFFVGNPLVNNPIIRNNMSRSNN